jgi:hypothetical protein
MMCRPSSPSHDLDISETASIVVSLKDFSSGQHTRHQVPAFMSFNLESRFMEIWLQARAFGGLKETFADDFVR